MKHILILGSGLPNSLERYYQRAFARIGVEASLFDPEAGLSALHKRRVLNRLTLPLQHHVVDRAVHRFFDNAPHHDAVLVFKGFHLSAATIIASRRRAPKVPWANLNPDSPFDPGRATSSRHIRAAIELYDAYFIWSRGLLPRLTQVGCTNPQYLAFGFDPDSHFPSETVDVSLTGAITFVGSHDAQRASVLESIADLPLRIFGNAWNNLPKSSRLTEKVVSAAIHGPELRRVVTSSLASINILRPQNAGSHNMRTFEVPAMGGLMLTSRSDEQKAFFAEGESALMYSDLHELRATALALLAGEFDTKALRERALASASKHSYDMRATQIVETLSALQF